MGKSMRIDFKAAKKHARELRRSMTDSEILLWRELRNRRLSGYKFLRQHPIIYRSNYKGIRYFIADFYCDMKKVVIELDGPIHEENADYDKFRDEEMINQGLKILRIKNQELLDMKRTLQKIEIFLKSIS
jgi:very-short-patch-repair endonuclease